MPSGARQAFRDVARLVRDHGEALWDALNSWLEAWEGERGIPTAYVVGTMQYVGLAPDYVHEAVDHAVEYVRGSCHTNGLENYWSLLKRCI